MLLDSRSALKGILTVDHCVPAAADALQAVPSFSIRDSSNFPRPCNVTSSASGTGSTIYTIPYDINSQECPAGTGVVSLANAGLEAFNPPSFTAPPMVYGNFDSLRAMVYPNDAANRDFSSCLDFSATSACMPIMRT